MNIVGKLTLRHLKENKKRTLATIFGVIVSVAMITAVTTAIPSFLQMMSGNVSDTEGDWIGYYMNVEAQHIDTVKNYDNVDQVVVCKDLGNYMIGNELDSNGKNMLSVRGQPIGSFDHIAAQLLEGTYPADAKEMMIQKSFLQKNGLDWKVGDTVTLNQLSRYWADGEAQDQPVRQFNSFSDKEQRYETGEQRTFRISGIFYAYSSKEYNAIAGFDPGAVVHGETVDLYTTQTKLSLQSGEQVRDLSTKIGDFSNVTTHNDYLRYSGYLVGPEAGAIYGASAIMMLIIMIASVTLIYNAFAISISERSRYLGMLASVGATKKQKRSTIYYEGAFIGAIGIPVGILAGLGGIGLTFYLLGPTMQSMLGSEFEEAAAIRLVVSPLGIGLSILLSIITILISAYLPGRRASRTSPIDAIRGSKEVTASAKKLKTSHLTRKLFGYEGELALKNMKRNRKKYRVIVGSLAISVILFLTVNGFTGMMMKSTQMVNTTDDYDIRITVRDDALKAPTDDFIKTLDGIDRSETAEHMQMNFVGSSSLFTEKGLDASAKMANDQRMQMVSVYGLPDEMFNQLCDKNGINPTPFFNKEQPQVLVQNFVYDYVKENDQMVFREYTPLQLEKGQTLALYNYDDVIYSGDQPQLPAKPFMDMQVQAVVNKAIYTLSSGQQGVVTFLLPQSVYAAAIPADASGNAHEIRLHTKEFEALDDTISSYIQTQTGGDGRQISMYNSALDQQQMQQVLLVMNVFFYGFITLITLICVTNIFNTIATGIQLRRREFAMIKSVGMTPKGFRRMVAFESLFYGIKALLIGLPVGALVHIGMWKMLGGSFELNLSDTFNVWIYGIVTLAVFMIVSVTLLYSVRKVRKDNIVETLKNEDS